MDLEALLKNIDAFKARLDALETELATKNAELERVTINRDSILKEKRRLEGRDDLGAMEARIRDSVEGSGASNVMTISRADAQDGSKYREARDAAEKAGVPLQIVGSQAPVQAERRSSPVRLVKDADSGICYVNAELIDRHGQARCRQIAAEQGSTKIIAFRSADDLPNSVRQAHAQAIADRTNLLSGGE